MIKWHFGFDARASSKEPFLGLRSEQRKTTAKSEASKPS